MSESPEGNDDKQHDQQNDLPARTKGNRFRDADDPQQQLEQIEDAQRLSWEGKLPVEIDSIEKSKQRLKNRLKQIRSSDDLDDLP